MYAVKAGFLRESWFELSGTASSSKGLATVASPVAEGVASEPDAVEYPEGHWIAQSVWHEDAVRLATTALDYHFRDRHDVLVAMELVIYYVRGDNRVWLQPDVQVVFGVGRGGSRRTFNVWEEGKPPDFVLEVASPSTAENDTKALERQRRVAENRASAAEDELSRVRDELRSAEERVRVLEQRLRDRKGETRPSGRDPSG